MISDPVSTYTAVGRAKEKRSFPLRISGVALAAFWFGWCVIVWSGVGTVIWLLSLISVLAVFWVIEYSCIMIAEKDVAVVYNRKLRAFSRFLPSGRHWLIPGIEVVLGVVSMRPTVLGGKCRAHSAESIYLDVDWKVIYHLDPFLVEAELRSNMARTMRHRPAAILESQVQNCIQHLLETMSLDDLQARGMQMRLENRLRRLIATQLSSYGYVIHRVALDEFHFPEAVSNAIQQAYTRILHAHADAQALAIRQQAIRSFTKEDVNRLMELEQLRMLENRVGTTHVVLGQYHPVPQESTIHSPTAWVAQLAGQKAG